MMNTLKEIDGVIYTQNIENLPIEERIFVKKITGVSATNEYYRVATDIEIANWKEYQRKLEEEMP